MTDTGAPVQGFEWACHACGASGPLTEDFSCPRCGDPRSLRALAEVPAALFHDRPKSLWHYAPLLPVRDPFRAVTLGEARPPSCPRGASRGAAASASCT